MIRRHAHRWLLLLAAMALSPFLMGSNCVVVGIPDGFWGYDTYDVWYDEEYVEWGWYDYWGDWYW